jgi:hypothetical protein
MNPKKLNCKSAVAFGVKGTDALSVSYELEIVNGVVTRMTQLNAPDRPAISLGKVQKRSWEYYREQKIESN